LEIMKKEIAVLARYESQKGLTIVPISVYNDNRKLKVEIAAVKPRKKFDKRELLKKRDADRESQRTLKDQ